MDLNYLRRLVKIFDDSKATHLEIEEDGTIISLAVESATIGQVGSPAQTMTIPFQNLNVPTAPQGLAQAVESSGASKDEAKKDNDSENLHTINSPIVGTFYRSPSPDSDPFVE